MIQYHTRAYVFIHTYALGNLLAFDYVRMLRSRNVKQWSNVKHIEAIDEASSIGDVAQLMSSQEASGYTYHGEPGPEN